MRPLSDTRPPNFVDWDNRPAMPKPKSPWVRVNAADVANSADVLDEEEWRDQFKEYGELDPPLEFASTRRQNVSPP
jgi:hypothetical protein